MTDEEVDYRLRSQELLTRISCARDHLTAALGLAQRLGLPTGVVERALAALDGKDPKAQSERLQAIRCAVCRVAPVAHELGYDTCAKCEGD